MTANSTDGGTQELDPASPILFLFLILILGSLTNEFLKRLKAKVGLRLPYSVGLICIGLILGLILYESFHCRDKDYSCVTQVGVGTNGQFQESMLMWMNMPGELILFIFLPPLIYEGSAYTNVYKFSKHFASGVILAGPGVIIQTALIGSLAKFMFPYNWSWVESLLFGGILSATDPIAVIALLKELGCLPDLRVLIEAESVLNDGTAIVVYQLCYYILTEPRGSASDYVADAFQLSLGGPAIGILFCIGTMGILSNLHNPLLETTVTIASAYLCFFTAQGSILVSGVLAVMTLGVMMTMYGQSVISHEAHHFLHVFWGMVEFMANTVIFILAGAIIIYDAFLLRNDKFTASDWGYLFANYVLLFFVRLLMLLLCGPYVRLFGYRLTSKDCSLWDFIKCLVFAAWAGLRGVVGMSLGLIVYNDKNVRNSASDPLYPERVLFHVCGLVALTLLINGPTTEYVIRMLGLGAKKSAAQQHLESMTAQHTTAMIKTHLLEQFFDMKALRQNSVHRQVDWDSVRRLIGLASQETQLSVPNWKPPDSEKDEFNSELSKQTSIRFYQLCLEAVKTSYEEEFSDHLIGGRAFRALEFAVNCADDFIQTQNTPMSVQKKPHTPKEHDLRYFDVPWISGMVEPKSESLLVQLKRYLPERIRDTLAHKKLEYQIEAALAVFQAYKDLQEMLESAVTNAHELLSEISAILTFVQLRLAKLQCESPSLFAMINGKRIAIALIKTSRAEIERLHDTFRMRDAEFESLSLEYKMMARQVRYGRHVVSAPTAKDLAKLEPLFKSLTFEHYERLWSSVSKDIKVFAKGKIIRKQGEQSEGVVIVVSGFAKVMAPDTSDDDDRKCVRVCMPGTTYGDALWLLQRSGQKRTISNTLVAGSELEAFVVNESTLKAMVDECPVLLEDMWRARSKLLLSELCPDLLEPYFDSPALAISVLESAVLKSFAAEMRYDTKDYCILITGCATIEPQEPQSDASPAAEVRDFGILKPGQHVRFLGACNHILSISAPSAPSHPPNHHRPHADGRRQSDWITPVPTFLDERGSTSLELSRASGGSFHRLPPLQRSGSSNCMRMMLEAARREARHDKKLCILDMPI